MPCHAFFSRPATDGWRVAAVGGDGGPRYFPPSGQPSIRSAAASLPPSWVRSYAARRATKV
eukprot:scaffold32262_cov75-Phaeocystis_antarctica.AAC.6